MLVVEKVVTERTVIFLGLSTFINASVGHTAGLPKVAVTTEFLENMCAVLLIAGCVLLGAALQSHC